MEYKKGPIIGHGSSATVSVATTTSGDVFAVKSTSTSLQKEQNIMSQVNSKHVIKYMGYEVSYVNNTPMYNLYMEYAQNGSVSDMIKKSNGSLDENVIRLYTKDILMGLDYLHGVGEEQGFPADVWALGCSVIEMATGSNAWPEINDPVSGLYKIGYSGELPEFPKWLSDDGKDFLEKCLRIDVNERWSVKELLEHPFVCCSTSLCLPNWDEDEEDWIAVRSNMVDETNAENDDLSSVLVESISFTSSNVDVHEVELQMLDIDDEDFHVLEYPYVSRVVDFDNIMYDEYLQIKDPIHLI
nr:mitogen-activated protein kinase kinase kinase 18-like [Tanacetum cinerariifolium]